MDVTLIGICQNENLYQGPYKMTWIRNTAGIFLAVCGLASELPALHGRFVISYYFRESCVSNFMVLSLLVIHTPLTHTHTITHSRHKQSHIIDTHNQAPQTHTITHHGHTQSHTPDTHNHAPHSHAQSHIQHTITHPRHKQSHTPHTITHPRHKLSHTHNHTPQTHLQ